MHFDRVKLGRSVVIYSAPVTDAHQWLALWWLYAHAGVDTDV